MNLIPMVSKNPKYRVRHSLALLSLLALMLGAKNVSAQIKLQYSDLSYGYSDCYYKDNGNGTSTIEVTIAWKPALNHVPPGKLFASRGVLFYTYGANGSLDTSYSVPTSVTLDGQRYTRVYKDETHSKYTMYGALTGTWIKTGDITARVAATFYNYHLQHWPAIGVRAGNFTTGDDMAEITGLAYLSTTSTNGQCHRIINPETPPPPVNLVINMNAPDWNLGELKRGEETEIQLNENKDQLCFTYNSGLVAHQRYALKAQSETGHTSDGKSYLLKHSESPGDTIPYRLRLDEGSGAATSVSLPSASNTYFSLRSQGRTCFSPTFHANAAAKQKGGSYGDVLTFTVTAQP